jgi:hypothetical protein
MKIVAIAGSPAKERSTSQRRVYRLGRRLDKSEEDLGVVPADRCHSIQAETSTLTSLG